MITIAHNYSGASIKELKEKYGKGKDGLCPQTWYENEEFLTEKPSAGKYEIILKKDFNKTLADQTTAMPADYTLAHPAIVLEAILEYNRKNTEQLLENWYVNTSARSSGGGLVFVGGADAEGAHVDYWWPNVTYVILGVSFSRSR